MQDKEITLDWTPFALGCLNEIHYHITRSLSLPKDDLKVMNEE